MEEPAIDPPLPPLPSPVEILRACARLALVLLTVALAWLEYVLVVRRVREDAAKVRARWLHNANQRAIRLLSVRIECTGKTPVRGLVVSNHLSYLDIILLGAIAPFAFVSKAEVSKWPVFGFCARCGGTIFIDRKRRGDVLPVAAQIRETLAAGIPVVLFPEGTSSGGETVLPFKPALFAAVLEADVLVTPCAITYHLPNGSVPDEVCYWGGDHFVPHIFNLLGKVDLRAEVHFGEPRRCEGDRKEIARTLRDEVVALRDR